MRLIIIAGMPASGKSTVARELSARIGYPVIEKDELKETLFDTLGFSCYSEKRHLDVVATELLLRVSDQLFRSDTSHIIVNNFRSDKVEPLRKLIDKYSPAVAPVFFGGDSDVFYRRYVDRDNRGERHLGHVLQLRYPPLDSDPKTHTMTRSEFYEKFEALGMDDFDIGIPKICVDATDPSSINIDDLLSEINKTLEYQEKIMQNGEDIR